MCGSFEVLTIDESNGDFKINRPPMKVGEPGISHCINVNKKVALVVSGRTESFLLFVKNVILLDTIAEHVIFEK